MKQETQSILIVDDEFSVRDSLTGWFRKDGYETSSAKNGEDALKKVQERNWDTILLDIRMPGMSGMEVLKRLTKNSPDSVIIMLTAHGTIDTAVQAMKDGAFDYINKPVDPDDLSRVIKKAMEHQRLKSENTRLKMTINKLTRYQELVGVSPVIQKIKEQIRMLANTDVTVLIRGESGTGKELIARAIHASGPRRFFSLVPVNCGAIPESLLETELFGHEKGAFTGAQQRHRGKIELAHEGTLFLDEVGSIGTKMQVELLRVLETKEYTRIGGTKSINANFRIICATNQNLEQLVEFGAFRHDFYFRINVFTITVPPLRDRRSDIPLLVEYFLEMYARKMNIEIPEITSESMEQLTTHQWPGNIRELANTLERATVLCQGQPIVPDHLQVSEMGLDETIEDRTLDDIIKSHIKMTLEAHDWNISKVAQVLHIDRTTLYNRIKKYGLKN